MSYLDIIKPGAILNHKHFGKGFVSKCRKDTDGSVVMFIDFNDNMGQRHILVESQFKFNKFFHNNKDSLNR